MRYAKEDVSAEKEKEEKGTWVQKADEKSRWEECFKKTSEEKAKETFSLMLPKENRLTDDYDFRRVKRLGTTYHCPIFRLTVVSQKTKSPPRFGFVISTKVDKRATVRNRIKRLLREAVHALLSKIPDGFDLVFVVRPSVKGKSYEEIYTEVDKVLSKVSFR